MSFGSPLNGQDADHERATLQKMELDRDDRRARNGSGKAFAEWVQQTANDHAEIYREGVEAGNVLHADRGTEEERTQPPRHWEADALEEIDRVTMRDMIPTNATERGAMAAGLELLRRKLEGDNLTVEIEWQATHEWTHPIITEDELDALIVKLGGKPQ